MKIAIIGGGSLGLLFSYYLGFKNEVTIYTRTKEQADEINKNGLHLIKGGIPQPPLKVSAAAIQDWKGTEEFTVVAVKQYQLSDLMAELRLRVNARGSILFLQNGYGHIKMLPEITAPDIYVGSVEHGAVRENEYTVQHNGFGVTRTAVFRGEDRLLREFSLRVPDDFPILFESDYKEMLIKKLVVNAVINPLTAILKVRNGELINNSFYFEVFKQMFEECALVLGLEHREEYLQNLMTVCTKTADNHSSMYKDIENGRQTEIDAILGYLLELSISKNIKAPLIHNYYHCIKGKEQEREGA
ncbi:2-dehydropantoate 2-reductase [Bacillus sp. ISL-35]|uniref:2-dehydropantoate 2-reductase n=1 Tax=Bacillus sp. ISL-35 TaxID=2819122 RepID=UPI001BE5BE4C|nr:2-dehydropantoate 2-reductase [Bacillus sp. ISL-35]MBT2678466.1 2-dehydropantoate 2-reductase [Bacillus sp. ISL-35]MBT2701715.1 2-dehydropantoate 2-reductase [Chryseobacterium sp. ISL-80]